MQVLQLWKRLKQGSQSTPLQFDLEYAGQNTSFVSQMISIGQQNIVYFCEIIKISCPFELTSWTVQPNGPLWAGLTLLDSRLSQKDS